MALRKKTIDGYIKQVEDYCKNLPQVSKDVRDFISRVLPWYALLFGILSVINALSYLIKFGGQMTIVTVMVFALTLLSGVLLLVAFSRLQNYQYAGWRFVYFSVILSIVKDIITTPIPVLEIILGFVGIYLLYQVRLYYK